MQADGSGEPARMQSARVFSQARWLARGDGVLLFTALTARACTLAIRASSSVRPASPRTRSSMLPGTALAQSKQGAGVSAPQPAAGGAGATAAQARGQIRARRGRAGER